MPAEIASGTGAAMTRTETCMSARVVNAISDYVAWCEHGKSIAAAAQMRHARDIKKARSLMKKNQS